MPRDLTCKVGGSELHISPAATRAIPWTSCTACECPDFRTVSGFGTFGYAESDQPYRYLRFIDDNGTLDRDSVLGVQFDAELAPRFSATVQIKAAAAVDNEDDWEASVRWAFIASRPNNDWLLRLGRARVPLYLNSLKSTGSRKILTMTKRLRGMYAFGIWDARRQELLLARDPFGIKPLYYSEPGGVAWFASQARALVDTGMVANTPETGCDPSRIVVIPNHVSDEFIYHPKEFNAERPRILQIGTKPNKNLERIVQALIGIDCTLVIVGDLTQEQQNQLAEAKVDYEHWECLSRESLLVEYQKSDIVAFVSTYEGFGLPVLEAQSTGRPVVTSVLCSMPDVAGEGAVTVYPLNVEAIRCAFRRLTEDNVYREAVVTSGLLNVERYRLPVVAKQYREIYQLAADRVAA